MEENILWSEIESQLETWLVARNGVSPKALFVSPFDMKILQGMLRSNLGGDVFPGQILAFRNVPLVEDPNLHPHEIRFSED